MSLCYDFYQCKKILINCPFLGLLEKDVLTGLSSMTVVFYFVDETIYDLAMMVFMDYVWTDNCSCHKKITSNKK